MCTLNVGIRERLFRPCQAMAGLCGHCVACYVKEELPSLPEWRQMRPYLCLYSTLNRDELGCDGYPSCTIRRSNKRAEIGTYLVACMCHGHPRYGDSHMFVCELDRM